MTVATAGTLKMPQPTQPSNNIEFTRVNEQPVGETITALVYGGSKAGKTWFFGTAGDRALIVDTGDSSETIKSPLFKKLVGANPFVIKVREKLGDRGSVDAAEAFDLTCDIIDEALVKLKDDIDFVILDEATALRGFSMNKSLEVNQNTGKSKSLVRSRELDANILTKQDYGMEMDLTYKFFGGYKTILANAGKHFIVGAHEKPEKKPLKDNEGKVVGEYTSKISPLFTGKSIDPICALFDEIWHMEKVGGDDNIVHRLRLSGYGFGNEGTNSGSTELIAGTRHAGVFVDKQGRVENIIKNPNLKEMVAQIRAASVASPKSKGV